MDRQLIEAFRFFHENAGYIVGRRAVGALALARAEIRAKREGVSVIWDRDPDPWDADVPEPPIVACAHISHPEGGPFALAALGQIGLMSWSDPYVRVVEAELFAEAFDTLDDEHDHAAQAQADELASRATFAG